MITVHHRSIPIFVLFISLLIFFGVVIHSGIHPAAADTAGWQTIETPGWVSAEIPPGWEVSSSEPGGSRNETIMVEAISPEGNSRLFYFIEQTDNTMTRGEMEAFQDQWMKAEGYRICMTHDPVFRMKADHTSLKKVYVQGTENGAVMLSAGYPGWGMTHVALLMEGSDAVEAYYNLLPAQFEDHILPIPASSDTDTNMTDSPSHGQEHTDTPVRS